MQRGQYLPLEQRMPLYNKVLLLRQQELSYTQIVARILESDRIRLSTARISDWINGKGHPLGSTNKFDATQSLQLAGVIGALLSDGNRRLRGSHYELRLRVNDYEYAYEFGCCLAKVLGRKEPYKPHWSRSERRWIVTGSSILLYRFLDHPWRELKAYIEADRAYVAAFLRMFFDGEAHIFGRKLVVYNTDKGLMRYVRYLLRRYFDIEVTGPHISQKAGRRFHNPSTGKTYRAKNTCYYLHVRANDLPQFRNYVGFSIQRKQRRLMAATQNSSTRSFPSCRGA